MPEIRPYADADLEQWHRMRTALWPDQTRSDMATWLARADAALFVAESAAGRLCGFVEVGERPFADGCETGPVAYVEGWYVDPDVRLQSVGTQLIRAVETWARSRGYRELGSDTELHNVGSQRAHERLGFLESERLVLYRKAL